MQVLAEERVIRERHLMQLYGTTIPNRFKLAVRLPRKAVLVHHWESVGLLRKGGCGLKFRFARSHKRLPMIKCNISATTGERIFTSRSISNMIEL